MLKLRTVKIAYWVFCASKHNRKFQILTFGEIHTIRFSNFNRIRIRILFGFGKSGEYEYEYIRFWKIIRIRIRIVFGLKISAEYEYEYHYSVSTIRILFEYRIIRSPLTCHPWDIWSGWWGDITWSTKRQWQRQRQWKRQRQWQLKNTLKEQS